MFSVPAPFSTTNSSSTWKICVLDIDNKLHLFALHYIFLPRINNSRQQFISMWNNHPLGTERNLSPTQLWITGEHPQDHEEMGSQVITCVFILCVIILTLISS